MSEKRKTINIEKKVMKLVTERRRRESVCLCVKRKREQMLQRIERKEMYCDV